MKKLSYFLASAISTLVALASTVATATTTEPDRGSDANTISEATSSANPIAVSESAKLQIGAQALEGKTLLAAQKLGPVRGTVSAPSFKDSFQEIFRSGINKKKK